MYCPGTLVLVGLGSLTFDEVTVDTPEVTKVGFVVDEGMGGVVGAGKDPLTAQ